MPNPYALAAIPAGAELIGGIMGNVGGARASRDARRWQEKMWNLQNEYNSPANQRALLEAAGMNPNLAYGNGSMAQASNPPGSPDVYKPDYSFLGRGAAQAMNVGREMQMLELAQKNQELAEQRFKQQQYMDEFKAAEAVSRTFRSDIAGRRDSYEFDRAQQNRKWLDGALKESYESMVQNRKQSQERHDSDMSTARLSRQELSQRIQKLGHEVEYAKYDALMKRVDSLWQGDFKAAEFEKLMQDYGIAKASNNRAEMHLLEEQARTRLQERGVSVQEERLILEMLRGFTTINTHKRIMKKGTQSRK